MVRKSDILMKFGERIKYLRAQKGIPSQMHLSLMTGLDRTYIGGIERGERNIGLKNIEKLAKAFNIEVAELLKF